MGIKSKGLMFAFYTAIVSGFSVFLSATAVKVVPNAFFFTTAKNTIVALLIISLLVGLNKINELKKLKKSDWLKLSFVGLIGGSVPFLLFFKGMSLSSQAALNGAFIHKTLFIWVAMLALVFLKEKLTFLQYGAIAIILVGIYMVGGPKSMNFGAGEILILTATLMWAFEAVIVKKLIKGFDAQIMAFGRMFFGSMIMIGYLIVTNNYSSALHLNDLQATWIILTSILLFLYVNFYYLALKHEKASVVTSILTVAFPITVVLQNYSQGAYILKSVDIYLPLMIGVGLILVAPKLREKLKVY